MTFYYADEANNVIGPVTREHLQKMLDAGVLAAATQVCYEGSEEWAPITTYIRPTPKPQPPPPLPTPAKAPVIPTTNPPPAKKPRGCRDTAALGCLGIIGAIFLGSIISAIFGGVSHSSSSSYSSTTSSDSIHDQRESDTRRGFSFGREIGARRAREGFPKPSVEYLDALVESTTPSESAGYKLGFKAGYIDGWEKAQ